MENLGQWITRLRFDVHKILASYKRVCVHTCKFALVCTRLQEFYKNLAKYINSDSILNIHEYENMQSLISLVTNIYETMISLSEEQYLQSVLSHPPNFYMEYTIEFRQKFNLFVSKLNLTIPTPFQSSTAQDCTDNLQDLKNLQQLIQGISEPKVEAYLVQLTEAIKELETEPDFLRTQTDSNVTQEEVMQQLAHLSNFFIDRDNYIPQKKIGQGGYADVYLGYQRSPTQGFEYASIHKNPSKKAVALKKLRTAEFRKHEFEMFKREIEIMSKLNHKAILPFVGVCPSSPYLIVTEFMSGGCLFDRLRSPTNKLKDPTKLTIIALGVAHGLKYMHSMKVMHRDLKSLNILLDADDFPKICDFGMSRDFINQSNFTGSVGTLRWMAPEVMKDSKYTEKADVYSYGILLWELLTGDAPFKGMPEPQISYSVLNNNARPLLPQNAPPRISMVIKRCWDADPAKRPDFDSVLEGFASGEIEFPGTKREEVKAYLSLLEGKEEIDLSKENLNEMLIKIESGCISETDTRDVMKKLFDLILDSNDVSVIFPAVRGLSLLSGSCPSFEMWLTKTHKEALMTLFSKFGTTSMLGIVELLGFCTSEVFLNEHFNRLSAFLVSSDLDLRTSTAKLLIRIVRQGKYNLVGDLNVLVHSIIVNIIPEAVEEVLNVMLELLRLVLKFDEVCQIAIQEDVAKSVLSLFVQGDAVVLESMEILKVILGKQEYIQNVQYHSIVKLTLLEFGQIVKRDSDTLVKPFLEIFDILSKNELSHQVIKDHSSLLESMSDVIRRENEGITCIGLSILIRLVSVAWECVRFAYEPVVDLLDFDSDKVKFMASSFLTILIQKGKFYTSSTKVTKFIVNYMKSGERLFECAARLLGVISRSVEVVKELERELGWEKLFELLEKGSKDEQKMSLLVLASVSAVYPIELSRLNYCDTLLNFLNEEDTVKNVLIFVANTAVCDCFAKEYAKRLDMFSSMIKEEVNEVTTLAFTCLKRILSCYMVKDCMGDVKGLVKVLEKSWKGSYETSSVEVFALLSHVERAMEVMKSEGVIDNVYKHLCECEVSNPLRSHLIQIYSRAGVH